MISDYNPLSLHPRKHYARIRNTLCEALCRDSGLLSLYVYAENIDPIFDILLGLTHRLTALSLESFTEEQLHLFLELPPHSFRSLETLQVTLCDSGHTFICSFDAHVTSLHTAPKLQCVWLRSFQAIQSLFIPLVQLTDLMVDIPISADIFYSALRECMSITCCVFNVHGALSMTSTYRGQIVLPSLTDATFKLQNYPLQEDILFDPFTIPKLRSLSVQYEDIEQNPLSLTSLRSLVIRSKCPLKELQLIEEEWENIEVDEIEHLLESLPSLVNFTSSFPARVFERIQLGSLLPQLVLSDWSV